MVALSLLLVACNVSAAGLGPGQTDESGPAYAGKKILWVDSYHQGYEWSDGVYAGLKDVLDETGVELEVIHMDTKRNTDEGFRQAAAIEAKAKIETFSEIPVTENRRNELIVNLDIAERLDIEFAPHFLKSAQIIEVEKATK